MVHEQSDSGVQSGETDEASSLAISSKLLIAFGLVFELPIVIFFLARMGVVDYHWLAKNRKFALLTGFLVGAVLTPPDVFSQTALALPFVVLYEVGIWVARFFGKKPEAEDEAGADDDEKADAK